MSVPPDTGGQYRFEVSNQPPADWGDLQSRDPACEYSQTSHWTETVAAQVADARSVWLTARRAGELVAGLSAIARRVTRPVGGVPVTLDRLDASFEGTSGGPLFSPDLGKEDRDFLFGQFVDSLGGLRRGVLGSCALVLNPDQEKLFGPLMSGRKGWVRHDALTAAVPLAGGIDEVEKSRMVNNKRNERNRALRRGVDFLITTDRDLVAEYYRIYEQAARHWGVPPPPLGLLQELVADPDQGVFFTCVRLEGKVIGGHLNIHHGKRVLVWNGVTDPAYAREYFPATLCFWGDLVESCRRGATWLDLGGSAGVSSLSGFKKFFGAEIQMRGLYFNDAPVVKLVKQMREAWRHRRGDRHSDRWHDKVSEQSGRDG